ncbi:hypothetical protein [Streptomyces sp. NPDC051567]|uniref:hypothetical protein n=1 Tax=Streptomyces sp. NPDC051567 TaxID=3365660 RepID=UPI0037B2D9B2
MDEFASAKLVALVQRALAAEGIQATAPKGAGALLPFEAKRRFLREVAGDHGLLPLLRLDRAAHRRWFLPVLAVFPLSGYALPVLPHQMLLTGLSALHPRRWRVIALTFVTASVLGAFLTATAVRAAGPWLLETVGAVAPGPERARGRADPAPLVRGRGPVYRCRAGPGGPDRSVGHSSRQVWLRSPSRQGSVSSCAPWPLLVRHWSV